MSRLTILARFSLMSWISSSWWRLTAAPMTVSRSCRSITCMCSMVAAFRDCRRTYGWNVIRTISKHKKEWSMVYREHSKTFLQLLLSFFDGCRTRRFHYNLHYSSTFELRNHWFRDAFERAVWKELLSLYARNWSRLPLTVATPAHEVWARDL